MLGNHLLGLYEKALDPADSWKTRLEKVKALGFDYMEISIDESDARLARLDWTAQQRRELREICCDAGVTLQSMCLSAHRRFPFGSSEPALRSQAYTVIDKAIGLAADLGVRVIQLAGYDVYYEPSTPQSVRLFRDGLRYCAAKAEQHQIMLAMEVMDTPFLNSISKNMAYEAMLHSPWYRVYPDMGNISAWPENDVDFEFRGGIDSIVAVHLKDTLAVTDQFPGKFKCVPFGAGCVDFPRRFAQLEQLGYMGPYMIEMWYDAGSPDDLTPVRQAKAWLEEQFRIGTRKDAACGII